MPGDIKRLIIIIFFLLILLLFPYPSFAQTIDPQYIFVRKDPMCDQSKCYLWNLNDPNQINIDAINEIFNKVGTKGNSNRRLGIAIQLLTGLYSVQNLQTSLQKLLDYSLQYDFPVFIQLESHQFWHNLPQLWKWWEPNISSAEIERRKNNVDWTCWESSCAIKTAWRNWGTEFEVGTPPPNYSSQAVLDASKDNFRNSLLIITSWYNNLPQDKKYLFGGVSMENEVDVGWNYYYYPNGVKPDEATLNSCKSIYGDTLRCTVQLGYNSVKTAGIKSSGQLTTADLNEVIRRYIGNLSKFAVEMGIPRNKIYSHVGGKGIMPHTFPGNLVWPDGYAALNESASPGWSFYGGISHQPENYPALTQILDQIGTNEWASPEWNPMIGDYDGWVTALRNSLNFRNNRFINIANWDGEQNIKDLCKKDGNGNCIDNGTGHVYYAIDALKTVLNESPSCWVTSPVLNTPSINGKNVTLSWQNGENNVATYLNASTVGDFNPSGTLKNMNVINFGATGRTTYNLSNLSPGKYYWAVVADGCSPVQRRIANGQFEIGSPPTPTPIPPTLTPIPPSPTPVPTTPIPPSPTPTPIPGDITGRNGIPDGVVNIYDYNLLITDFGKSSSPADIDGNGIVDIYDYNTLVGNFGENQ